jgi:hypothetical protein
MAKWPWIERAFSFDYPPEKFPDLLERVRGTPARVEECVRGLNRQILTQRDDEGWSIQENIGHLHDTEYLALTRIQQIFRGEAVLVAADMENRQTHAANHNARDIRDVLAALRSERERVVSCFEGVAEADWAKAAFHRRLQVPLRIVDLACMVSEHDDYHLARIRQLIRKLGAGSERVSVPPSLARP